MQRGQYSVTQFWVRDLRLWGRDEGFPSRSVLADWTIGPGLLASTDRKRAYARRSILTSVVTGPWPQGSTPPPPPPRSRKYKMRSVFTDGTSEPGPPASTWTRGRLIEIQNSPAILQAIIPHYEGIHKELDTSYLLRRFVTRRWWCIASLKYATLTVRFYYPLLHLTPSNLCPPCAGDAGEADDLWERQEPRQHDAEGGGHCLRPRHSHLHRTRQARPPPPL